MRRELEIVCASLDDALIAQHNGATRIELCSALELGGCTPSVTTLKLIKQQVTIPVVAMVRVRGGGFNYSNNELQDMFDQATQLLKANADGIVFGFLTDQQMIDVASTKAMVKLVHSYKKEAIFHKAFDQTPSLFDSIQQLIECKVDRVLTEGGYHFGDIEKGLDTLAQLQKTVKNNIQILAGSGIRVSNIQTVIEKTSITQIHSGAKKVHTNSLGQTHIGVDQEMVKQLANKLFNV